MTQRETILKLLRANSWVTLKMLFEAGVGYTGRNRISELRRAGYFIVSHCGKRPSENAYSLLKEPMT